MKKYALLASALFTLLPQISIAWGGLGHRLIARIAERHITPRTQANLDRYLDHSIVEYSTWMDEFRTSPGYEMTTWWHMGTIDENGEPCGTIRPNGDGDALPQLINAVERLKDGKWRELSDSTVNVNIKYIIHIISDMHCPAHIFFSDLPGGRENRYGWFRLNYNGKTEAYHGLWDGKSLSDVHPEWKGDIDIFRDNFDTFTDDERRALSAGTPTDWMRDCGQSCHVIYDWAKPGDSIDARFFVEHKELAQSQIVKAAYRLARTLNELFDN
ncbi:MAG: S1/P1 nuclease [Alistipes sp.]|nr:S1/P1 nuclease [Alistipes sp.]